MKFVSTIFILFFSYNSMAEEKITLKYSCMINRSETLKIYEVNTAGHSEISLQIDHFLYGEKEVVHLDHPFIVDYGGVYMVTQDYGRSGYFFLRFEEGKKAAPYDLGNIIGRIDDNRFFGHAFGYKKGRLSGLPNCTRVIN
jgi:hypothetical protein